MDSLPPGPRTPSLLQQVEWLARPTELMRRCAARYGDPFTLRVLGQPPVIFFSSPAAVREVMTGDPDDLLAGEAAKVLEPVLGPSSLLLLDGARHHRERKLLMPPFHGERLRGYAEVMREATRRAIAAWPRRRPSRVHPAMQAITLDVILRTVFGLDAGAEARSLAERLKRWADQGTRPLGTWLLLLLPAADGRSPLRRALGLGMSRDGAPPPGGDLSRFVPWRRLVDASRELDAALRAEIARRRGGPGGADVLSLLLQARDEDGQGMTDDELRDEMLTLLVAGHETTATTLSWAMHHLLEHPEAMRRAVAEATDAGAGDPLAERPYLDAVIKETLRLTPVVPITARRLRRPMRIGGVDLPAGVTVAPCMWLTHRRPELWPDPERFQPARFLERGGKVDPYIYYPFGGGARRCLGMAFASLEMRVVLAELLARLSLRRAPGHRVTLVRRGITFAPSGGVRVIAA